MEIAKRQNNIDIAKAIGMIAIVYGHILQSGWSNLIVYAFHVPLFFFLSGFFIKTDFSFRDFIKKKFRTLMYPYFLASIISIAVYALLGSFAGSRLQSQSISLDFSIWHNLVGMIYGCGGSGYMQWNRPLWFLPCLFACSLIVFCLEKYLIRGRMKIRAAVTAINLILGYFVAEMPYYPLPFQIDVAFNMVFWMEAGAIVSKAPYKNQVSHMMHANIIVPVLTIFLLISGAVAAQFNERVNVIINDYGNYALYLLSSIALVAAVFMISHRLQGVRWLQYMGKHTMVILLFHKFPVLFFQTAVTPIKNILQDFNSLTAVVVALALTGVCIGSCLILGKVLTGMEGAVRNICSNRRKAT